MMRGGLCQRVFVLLVLIMMMMMVLLRHVFTSSLIKRDGRERRRDADLTSHGAADRSRAGARERIDARRTTKCRMIGSRETQRMRWHRSAVTVRCTSGSAIDATTTAVAAVVVVLVILAAVLGAFRVITRHCDASTSAKLLLRRRPADEMLIRALPAKARVATGRSCSRRRDGTTHRSRHRTTLPLLSGVLTLDPRLFTPRASTRFTIRFHLTRGGTGITADFSLTTSVACFGGARDGSAGGA